MDRLVIKDLFERTVTEHLTAPAIIEATQVCTYDELNRRANGIAAALQGIGLGPQTFVAIAIDSSSAYITAQLGVLKAGGIFMPIPLDIPGSRLAQVFRRTNPGALIIREEDAEEFLALIQPHCKALPVLILSGPSGVLRWHDGTAIAVNSPEQNPPTLVDGEAGAYVVFTSGSTGEPKIILGTQKGLSHFLHWEQKEFALDHSLRTLSLAPPTFDVSLRDILLPLTCGGAVCIPDRTTRRQIPALIHFVRTQGVNLIHCVPSLFREITSHLAEHEPEGFLGVAYLLLAGEALYGADVLRYRQRVKGETRLVNLYGPSETTLAKFFFRIDDESYDPGQIVPVGHPLPNTAVFILKGERLCKIGEAGEIHIKTPFRSKGYIGAPELNAQAFIQNPLSTTPDILYKTGDLGRYRPDRAVDYIGRIDRQVKLRGHRVELPEVEMAVAAIAGIRQVYVRPNLRDGLVDGLTCYYTVTSPLAKSQIIATLRRHLPAYMIPAFFLQLEKFPVNLHGKVDPNRLPKPEELLCQQENFVAPVTPTEKKVAALFAQTVEIERISIATSLLDAGANSLTMIKLAARLYRELGVQVDIATLFAHPTARSLAAWLDGHGGSSDYQPIPLAAVAPHYPLSPAQRRLWVLDRLEPGNVAYNIFAVDRMVGPLDLVALRSALSALVERHEILRTVYLSVDGEPRQQVLAESALLVECEEAESEEAAQERCRALAALPFDLTAEIPLRLRLLRRAEQEHLLVFTLHHIAGDGWSLGVLLQEFLALYRAARLGAPSPLPPPRLQYRDYATWQSARLEGGELAEARRYWLSQFAEDVAPLPLATDFPRPRRPDWQGATWSGQLEKELSRGLSDLALAQGASLFMVLQSVLRVLLYRYTMQEEIVLGTVSAGRTHPDLEEQVGFYVNTLALRETTRPQESFLTLLERVKKTTLDAFAHQSYPFDRLVDELPLSRDTAHAPLFDLLLVLQNHEAPDFVVDGLTITPVAIPETSSRFDLTFLFTPQGDELALQINYATALYREETIAALAGHLQQLAHALVAAPRAPVGQAEMLAPAERQRLLQASRGAVRPLPAGITVVDLLRAEAQRHPQRLALLAGEQSWSYGEVDALTDRMAQALAHDYAVTPGSRVGLYCSRGPWTVLAAVAVLKAAAVYVPIDARYPQERIALLLSDAVPAVVLRCEVAADELLPSGYPVIDAAGLAAAGAERRPRPRAPRPEAAAYVIYTSGSTGRPKGVQIPHRGLVNLVLQLPAAMQIAAGDRVLQFASPGFDSFVAEVFPALAQGATLVCSTEKEIDDPQQLLALLRRAEVTALILPPAYLTNFCAADLVGVKTLITAGESPRPYQVQEFAPHLRYINGYGPTENTVCATLYCVDASAPLPDPLPIGRPIANVACYLLDRQQRLVPDGVVGEIALAGVALADGYLGQEELTSGAFVTSPDLPGERLYRSGDQGKRRPDGELLFLGRRDDQVKVRGYRIELEEIRLALAAHPRLRDVAIVPVGVDGVYASLLAGYVAIDPAPAVSELRAYLSERLPSFMVPERWVAVSQLPFNRHGKLDSDALLASGDPEPLSCPAPLQSATEQRVAELFSELLQIAVPGREGNFLELGGQSIRAMQLAGRLHRHFGAQIPLREIYAQPTVAALAGYLDAQRRGSFAPIPPSAVAEDYPLAPAQQRLWAIDRMSEGRLTPYTLFGVSRLCGPLDRAALQLAFTALVLRHESLRTNFILRDGAPRQVIRPPAPFLLEEEDLGAAADPQRAAAVAAERAGAHRFDLAHEPLLRVQVLRLAADEAWLVIHLHHIIGDGWSLGVMQREVSTLYAALVAGERAELPALPVQYRDFSAWQAQLAESAAFATSGCWWREQFAGELPILDLPTDFPRPAVQSFAGATLAFHLPAPQVTGLQELSVRLQVTLFDLLMALCKTLLHRLTNAAEIIVGAPAAGRLHPDLEGQIGFYVNTLPLRDRIDPGEPFSELVRRVHRTHTVALEHQDYPFDRLVDELGLRRDTARNPLFDVVLALQNMESVAPTLGALTLEPLPLQRPVSHFDLTFYFSADASAVQIAYATDLFGASTIAGWFSCLETLVGAVIATPEAPLSDLALLPPATLAKLAQLNATFRALPPLSLPELFAEQVAQAPTACALVHRGVEYSYQWLAQASDLIAATLRTGHGNLRGRNIALLCDRGPAMLAAIFAVLKLGAAYVPIEPETPAERFAYLLADSGAALLVTDSRNQGPARQLLDQQGSQLAIVAIEALVRNLPAIVRPFPAAARADDLAYIMYTSGSSGRPKGVAVEHHSVVRLVKNSDYCRVRPGDRFLQLSSYAFDGSTFDIFMSLLNGATLCLPEPAVLRTPEGLGNCLQQEKISKFFITTALFNQLAAFAPQALSGCDQIFFGGQEASIRPVQRVLRELSERTEIVHVYGPTETTTFATYHPLRGDLEGLGRLPIGKPIANTTVQVLDPQGRPVPPGALGQLYIGGSGLARGYHGQPALTATKFVSDPAGSGARLYATGDLVRFNGDFDLEFVARLDTQVKLRGYRIELQEIQHALLTLPALRDVYIHPLRNDADGAVETLAAYFTLQAGSARPTTEELRRHLGGWLPDYMIPGFFIPLPALPLNQNGKVESAALPAPQQATLLPVAQGFVAPAPGLESQLAEILAQVIGRDRLGAHDNFFAAGGDSIKAIVAISRLREVGLDAQVLDLFEQPTVSGLATRVVPRPTLAARPQIHGVVPMVPVERWFFKTQPDHPGHFNQSTLLAAAASIAPAPLRSALQGLVTQHGALRCRYQGQESGVVEKIILAADGLDLSCCDLRRGNVEIGLHREIAKLYARMDIQGSPLFKAILFQTDRGDRLFLTCHHLVVDGVSWRILLEDLERAYAAAILDQPLNFLEPTASPGEWAAALQALAGADQFSADRHFWEEQLRVPAMSPRLPGTFSDKATVTMNFSRDFTEQLVNRANQAYQTRTDELLAAALAKSLASARGVQQVPLTFEGHGREPLVACDISRTVGWFTTLWPLTLQVAGDDPGRLVAVVKEQLRRVPARGLSFGLLHAAEEWDELLCPERVGFNFLGEFAVPAGNFFTPAPEAIGQEISPAARAWHLLDFTALIREGRLTVNFHYAAQHFTAAQISALSEDFRRWLEVISEHCCARQQSQATPSDFDFAGLSLEEFDGLVAGLALPSGGPPC